MARRRGRRHAAGRRGPRGHGPAAPLGRTRGLPAPGRGRSHHRHHPGGRVRPTTTLRPLLGVASLAATLAWLLAPSSGLPRPPADRSPGGLSAWLAITPPADVAAVLLRAGAALASAWLLLLLVLA